MKDINNLESELGLFLSEYMDPIKVDECGDDYPNVDHFLEILDDCIDLIKNINK